MNIDWAQVVWEMLGKTGIKIEAPGFLWAIHKKGLKDINLKWKEEDYKLLFYASFLLSNTSIFKLDKKAGNYDGSVNLVYKYKMKSHPLNCIAYSAIRQLGVKL